jgi:hypothetical protein
MRGAALVRTPPPTLKALAFASAVSTAAAMMATAAMPIPCPTLRDSSRVKGRSGSRHTRMDIDAGCGTNMALLPVASSATRMPRKGGRRFPACAKPWQSLLDGSTLRREKAGPNRTCANEETRAHSGSDEPGCRCGIYTPDCGARSARRCSCRGQAADWLTTRNERVLIATLCEYCAVPYCRRIG